MTTSVLLPLAATAAVWLWQRRPAGYLAGGTFLVFWLIESVGVATDQWFGDGHSLARRRTTARTGVCSPHGADLAPYVAERLFARS